MTLIIFLKKSTLSGALYRHQSIDPHCLLNDWFHVKMSLYQKESLNKSKENYIFWHMRTCN